MKKGTLILLAALAAAAIASYVLFKPSDQLEELKKTTEATEGQEELFRLVRENAAAARKPDAAKRLAPFMLIRDRAELERITEPLTSGPDLGELKFLGCTKLAVRNAAAPETWGMAKEQPVPSS